MTLHEVEGHTICMHYDYDHAATQPRCISRVEPSGNVETSISGSLQELSEPESHCERCGGEGACAQRVLGELPPSLVVHVDKEAGAHISPSQARASIGLPL